MKNLYKLLISTLFITTFGFGQTNVNGNVSGTWTTANSPYVVTNNLVLQPTDTLIIDPGVEVKFDGNYRFDIFGTFLAVGTESDSITFTKNGSTNWMSMAMLFGKKLMAAKRLNMVLILFPFLMDMFLQDQHHPMGLCFMIFG